MNEQESRSRLGVVLVHGLTGSPGEMRPLADCLAPRGMTVLTPRLPGHCTTIEDLERTTAGQWLAAVLDACHELRRECGRVAVCGLSMGGLLALVASTLVRVDKTVAMATPIYIARPERLRLLPPRGQCAGLFVPKMPRRRPPLGVAEDWQFLTADNYDDMPLASVHELLALIDRAKAVLPSLRNPLLVVQGQRDHTVNPESARAIVELAASADKRLLWLRCSGHRVTLGPDREQLCRGVAAFLLN